jgi:hypothetical protein
MHTETNFILIVRGFKELLESHQLSKIAISILLIHLIKIRVRLMKVMKRRQIVVT